MWHHYLEVHPPNIPEVHELKLCKTNRFEFNRVKKHQMEGLLKAKDGMFYKISDAPIFAGMKTRFNTKKPFDCLWIKAEAYVCIMFYIPRKRKIVIKMEVDEFVEWTNEFPKKSASLDEFMSSERVEVIKL